MLALLWVFAISTSALAGDGLAFGLALVASAAFLVTGLIFPLVTEPMNKTNRHLATHRSPRDWRTTLRRWELSHGLRAVLMATASVLLTLGALLDGPG